MTALVTSDNYHKKESNRNAYHAPFAAAAAAPESEHAALRESLGVGPGDVVFVCVARFAPQKAHDVLLRAFAAAREIRLAEGQEIELLLVGGDPFGDGVEKTQ